jgi:DNA-binding response OmpR family regulator
LRILIVEDSARMAKSLRKGLTEECFAADIASDGIDGLRMAATGVYDLVLLDINLPGKNGFELIRELREKRSDVPVIMVTARDDMSDCVEALDLGADDYVTKPFSFEELLARIRAVMRRPGSRSEPVLSFEDVELDPARGSARRGDRNLALSAREFSLLRVLMSNANRIMGRARLYEAVWGTDYDGSSNVLEVYINYLRNKLEDSGERRIIHTVRGRGYVLGDGTR